MRHKIVGQNLEKFQSLNISEIQEIFFNTQLFLTRNFLTQFLDFF